MTSYEGSSLTEIEAVLDGLDEATSLEVFDATRGYAPRAIASVAASRADAAGGGSTGALEDPGNVWTPNTAVTQGYRIGETWKGQLRVFEAVDAGTTTNDGSVFPDDYDPDLFPLAETTEEVVWRYLGIVGELPWDVVPLAGYTVDAEGFHVTSTQPFDESALMFQLLVGLSDPGNSWEAEQAIAEGGYRILVTIDGDPLVFENAGVGTTGVSEPVWVHDTVGQQTNDGSMLWSYRGLVGDPDTERPLFQVKTDGDADWILDQNAGAGFRFNQSIDGVLQQAGITQFTTDGFKVSVGPTDLFEVRYDPFSVDIVGLPTSDPVVAGRLWNSAGTLKISAG